MINKISITVSRWKIRTKGFKMLNLKGKITFLFGGLYILRPILKQFLFACADEEKKVEFSAIGINREHIKAYAQELNQ